jgi:hypothetical protein
LGRVVRLMETVCSRGGGTPHTQGPGHQYRGVESGRKKVFGRWGPRPIRRAGKKMDPKPGLPGAGREAARDRSRAAGREAARDRSRAAVVARRLVRYFDEPVSRVEV